MRAAPVTLAFVLAFAGCAPSTPGGSAPAERVATRVKNALVAQIEGVAAASTLSDVPAFREALRMERWAEALSVIEAQPAAVQNRPEVRYGRAAAAERVGDPAQVLGLLEALELELPLLGDRIRERRARAALAAGDARIALDYFGGRSDSESRLRFAQAQARLGEQQNARVSLDSLLRALPRRGSRCSIEAPARRLLSEVLPPEPPDAVSRELRWLAFEAPLCPSSVHADAHLEIVRGGEALTRAERLRRARAFAEAGHVEQTERELSVMERAPGARDEPGVTLALRGLSRVGARRELAHAAELLQSAAAVNPQRAAEWLLSAARARTRDGAVDDAIVLFERVRKSYPATGAAEYAAYQIAQLLYTTGRFKEADGAFEAYSRRYGKKGRFASDVLDERAVTWVMVGQPLRAARAFAELAAAAEPRDKARYVELEGVARLRAGERAPAAALFREVIRDAPLSFAALAATARLESLGLAVPEALTNPTVPASAAPELVVALPEEAELLRAIGLDREAELSLMRLEPGVARAFPGRASQALCMLYRRLASAERGYRIGQSAVTSEELQAAPRADRRWAWECVYPRPYAPLVEEHAEVNHLETELVYAVMRQESAFRPDVVSPVGALGLLQIMPSTGARLAAELGLRFEPERLREPPLNVRLGTRYLRKVLDVFRGNVPLAAAAYNAGPIAVERWLRGGTELELDLFVARIPYAETRGYVERVVGNYARYRYLRGGESAVPRLGLTLPVASTAGVDLY